MKTERRQELKANDLSIMLEQVSTYFKQHAIRITLIVVLVVSLVVVMVYRSYTAEQSQRQGWAAFLEAASVVPKPDDSAWVDQAIGQWEAILLTHDDHALRLQTHLTLAQFCLDQAIDTADQQAKRGLLDQAERHFQAVRTENAEEVVAQAAVLNGLAALEEDRFLIDGDISHKEKAKAHLETIRNSEMFLGTPFQTGVLARLNEFDDLWQPIVLVEPPPPPAVIEETPQFPDFDITFEPLLPDAQSESTAEPEDESEEPSAPAEQSEQPE